MATARCPVAGAAREQPAQQEHGERREYREQHRGRGKECHHPGAACPERAPEEAPQHRRQDGRQNEPDDDDADHRTEIDLVAAARAPRGGRRQRLAVDHADHPVDARRDTPVEIPLPEVRRDGIGDDALRAGIGEHAFEPVADLDAQAPVVLRNQQKRPVVDAFAPEPPLLRHAQRVLFDGLGLGGRHDQHRDLAALRRLECGELVLERLSLRPGQRPGQIGDARRERRYRDVGTRARGAQKRDRQQQAGEKARHPRLTCSPAQEPQAGRAEPAGSCRNPPWAAPRSPLRSPRRRSA